MSAVCVQMNTTNNPRPDVKKKEAPIEDQKNEDNEGTYPQEETSVEQPPYSPSSSGGPGHGKMKRSGFIV